MSLRILVTLIRVVAGFVSFLCQILFTKADDEKLGLSIKGGAGSAKSGNPFNDRDEGVFISKVGSLERESCHQSALLSLPSYVTSLCCYVSIAQRVSVFSLETDCSLLICSVASVIPQVPFGICIWLETG